MRHRILKLIILAASTLAVALPLVANAAESTSRKALLKAAIARDRGDISAMEPSSKDPQGVIVGYSSGAVLNCFGEHSCEEFVGTPSLPVEHISVSGRGGSEVIWVSYAQGALYRCNEGHCRKFIWDGGPPMR